MPTNTERSDLLASNGTTVSESIKQEHSRIQPIKQSIIQVWERQQDIHLGQPPVDMVDSWSSDGDSVSSSSTLDYESEPTSTDEYEKNNDDENADEILQLTNRSKNSESSHIIEHKNVHLLKHAGIFTSEEMIDQAIDRWQSYIRLCSRAINVLRQQLVDAYIPYALKRYKVFNDKIPDDQGLINSSGLSGRGQCRQRALRRLLHHSVKTANQRHSLCVSKFAVVSNRLAKWRKSAIGQQCRYRDPTTTTWEKHCTNMCLPLLPVCIYHLVQLKPAPDCFDKKSTTGFEPTIIDNNNDDNNNTGSNNDGNNSHFDNTEDTTHDSCQTIPTKGSELLNNSNCSHLQSSSVQSEHKLNIDKANFQSNTNPQCSTNFLCKELGDISQSSRSTRSGKGYIDPNVQNINSTISPVLQIPVQYLFRRCSANDGSTQACCEPVVAWNKFTRCINHCTINSICFNECTNWISNVNSLKETKKCDNS